MTAAALLPHHALKGQAKCSLIRDPYCASVDY